jgi:cell filamentation protein
MSDVHRRLVGARFLIKLSQSDFAQQVAVIIGDVNFIHPFREGNGRTQLQYLKLLSDRAGHPIDLVRIDPSHWAEASVASHAADYSLMARLIEESIPT